MSAKVTPRINALIGIIMDNYRIGIFPCPKIREFRFWGWHVQLGSNDDGARWIVWVRR